MVGRRRILVRMTVVLALVATSVLVALDVHGGGMLAGARLTSGAPALDQPIRAHAVDLPR